MRVDRSPGWLSVWLEGPEEGRWSAPYWPLAPEAWERIPGASEALFGQGSALVVERGPQVMDERYVSALVRPVQAQDADRWGVALHPERLLCVVARVWAAEGTASLTLAEEAEVARVSAFYNYRPRGVVGPQDRAAPWGNSDAWAAVLVPVGSALETARALSWASCAAWANDRLELAQLGARAETDGYWRPRVSRENTLRRLRRVSVQEEDGPAAAGRMLAAAIGLVPGGADLEVEALVEAAQAHGGHQTASQSIRSPLEASARWFSAMPELRGWRDDDPAAEALAAGADLVACWLAHESHDLSLGRRVLDPGPRPQEWLALLALRLQRLWLLAGREAQEGLEILARMAARGR